MPKDALHITRLCAADAAAYRALMLHAYAAAPDAFTSTPQEREAMPLAWWTQRITHPDGMSTVLGAWREGALAGAVTLEFSPREKTRHKAHLAGMFVRETARGLGIGKALVQAALHAAAEQPGVRSITLTVTEGNQAAIALYQACGFRPFGTEPWAIQTPQGFQAKVHMWLALPKADTAR